MPQARLVHDLNFMSILYLLLHLHFLSLFLISVNWAIVTTNWTPKCMEVIWNIFIIQNAINKSIFSTSFPQCFLLFPLQPSIMFPDPISYPDKSKVFIVNKVFVKSWIKKAIPVILVHTLWYYQFQMCFNTVIWPGGDPPSHTPSHPSTKEANFEVSDPNLSLTL